MSGQPALDSYEHALRLASAGEPLRPQLRLVTSGGDELAVPFGRYLGPPTAADKGVADRAVAPVLDVGCGPGRHLLALQERGVGALGIDISPFAVELARRRGAPAIRASVFEPLPREGRWGAVLLLDGNIGIGGDPATLLSRIAALLRPGGIALVEVEPSTVSARRMRLRFETADANSTWFAWGRVGADDVVTVGRRSGFTVAEQWQLEGRSFAALRRS